MSLLAAAPGCGVAAAVRSNLDPAAATVRITVARIAAC